MKSLKFEDERAFHVAVMCRMDGGMCMGHTAYQMVEGVAAYARRPARDVS